IPLPQLERAGGYGRLVVLEVMQVRPANDDTVDARCVSRESQRERLPIAGRVDAIEFSAQHREATPVLGVRGLFRRRFVTPRLPRERALGVRTQSARLRFLERARSLLVA